VAGGLDDDAEAFTFKLWRLLAFETLAARDAERLRKLGLAK
jgi:hypothetical protein